jgi:DNA polymerase
VSGLHAAVLGRGPHRTLVPDFPELASPGYDDDFFELCEWIESGQLIEAHSAWFERSIWTNIGVARLGWPAVQGHQWRCSASKAATHALPRNLEDAGAALRLSVQKDSAGHTLMMAMCKPRKPRKGDVQAWQNAHGAGTCPTCKGRGSTRKVACDACQGTGQLPGDVAQIPPLPVLWRESCADLLGLFDYCRTDVLSERALSDALPDLIPAETELYLLDQTINERGFALDKHAVARALELIRDETAYLNDQIAVLTDGQVTRGTQRQRMVNWFETHGLALPNTQAATIDLYLNPESRDPLTPEVRRGLELMRELGRSSTSKYTTMRAWACPDGRVHGGLLYHGAGTGRWSGAGVQPHNFVRGGKIKLSQDAVWLLLKLGERDKIRETYGSVMLVLSEALRGAICAELGSQLYVADYAAIEARVLLWLAGDEDGLNIFRSGEDIYCSLASDIYKRTITKKDKNERQLGKAAQLGLGYQMGAEKFVSAAAKYGVTIEDAFSLQVVQTFRNRFWRVPEEWSRQEKAAIEAVNSGQRIQAGKTCWFVEGRFLYCQLPSGRRLAYPDAEVWIQKTPWGERRPQMVFMGVNPHTHQWSRMHSYGGCWSRTSSRPSRAT